MALDPTIPLGIKPYAGPDLQGTMQTAGGLLGLQSRQQQLQANQIISEAYKQATDPTTGETDFGKLQALVSQSPAASFLPEFMGKIAQQRNQQVQFDTSKLELALKQQTDIRNRIGSLRAAPGFGQQDMGAQIKDTIIGAVQAGTLPVNQAVQELQNIPKTPQEQAAWVNQHFLNSMSGEAKIRAVLPQTQVVNTGGTSEVMAIDPMTGQPAVTGRFLNTMTPGEAATPVQATTPGGTPYSITKQQFANMATGAGQPPQQGGGGYTGRMQNPIQAQSDVPMGGVQAGLSPAEQARQTAGATAQAQGSAKAAQELVDSTGDAPMRINLLNQARDALKSITTGPGTEWRNNAKSLIAATPGLGDIARAAGLNPDNIKNYDEFKKIMVQYGNRVSAGLGGGTDARLNAALTGNANPGISSMANEDILTKTIAAEKMRQAQAYAFQNSGVPPDQFNKWQTQWNKEVSPDAFVFASMSAPQQKAFISRMKPAELSSFKRNLGNLVRSGVIEMPGGQ